MPGRRGHVPGAAPGGSADAASSPRSPPAAGAPWPGFERAPLCGAPLSPAAGSRPCRLRSFPRAPHAFPFPSAPCPSAGGSGQLPWRAEADERPGTAALPGQNFSSQRAKGGEAPGEAGGGWVAPLLNPSALRRGSKRLRFPSLYLGAAGGRAHRLFPQRREGGRDGGGREGAPPSSSRRPLARGRGQPSARSGRRRRTAGTGSGAGGRPGTGRGSGARRRYPGAELRPRCGRRLLR